MGLFDKKPSRAVRDLQPKRDRNVDLHFEYMAKAKEAYAKRETSRAALARAEEYCRKDIALFPRYRDALIREAGTLPTIPSFKMLAIILEKQERYEEAIAVCRQAIAYRIHDTAAGGFTARAAKLDAKRRKAQKC